MADPTSPYFSFWGFPQRKPQKKVLCVGVGETKSSSGSGGKGFPPRSGKRCVLSPPCLSTSAFVQTHSRPSHIHSPSRIKKACLSSRKHTWISPHKNTFSEIEFPALSSPKPCCPQLSVLAAGRTADRPCQDRGSFIPRQVPLLSWRKEKREGWNGGGKSRRHAIYAERKGPTEKADTTREASRADTRPFLLLFLESPRGILLCSADT